MPVSVKGITVAATFAATMQNLINTDNPASVKNSFAFTPETTFTTGTGANQFDRPWFAEGRTINSGNSEDLDLYDLASFDIGAGAGVDALGQAMTNAELVALAIWNRASSVGTLFIGAKNTTAAFQSLFHVNGMLDDTAGTLIAPGGMVAWVNPQNPAYVITDATNHLLKLAASGGNVTYDCLFFARSA